MIYEEIIDKLIAAKRDLEEIISDFSWLSKLKNILHKSDNLKIDLYNKAKTTKKVCQEASQILEYVPLTVSQYNTLNKTLKQTERYFISNLDFIEKIVGKI